MGEQTGVAE